MFQCIREQCFSEESLFSDASEHVWRPIFGLKNAPFLLILRYFFCPYHQYELQKDALSQQKIDTFYLQTRPPNML